MRRWNTSGNMFVSRSGRWLIFLSLSIFVHLLILSLNNTSMDRKDGRSMNVNKISISLMPRPFATEDDGPKAVSSAEPVSESVEKSTSQNAPELMQESSTRQPESPASESLEPRSVFSEEGPAAVQIQEKSRKATPESPQVKAQPLAEKIDPKDFSHQGGATSLLWKSDFSVDAGKEMAAVEERGGLEVLPEPEEIRALPLYQHNPRPEYPEVARRRGYEGTVEFELLVLVDGTVDDISMAKSSGHRSLDRAARKVLSFWRFSPALSSGVPVESRVSVPITFSLDN